MRSGMVRWAVASVILLVCAAVGVAQETPGGKLPADLALVPRDGTGFVVVRVGELWKKAEGLRKMAKDDPLLVPLLKEVDKKFGLSPQEIERALVICPDAQSKAAPVVVVTFARPYDRDKLLETIVPNGEDRTVGGKTFRVHLNNSAVYLVNDRTVLLGSVPSVSDFFRRSEDRTGAPVLNAALAAVGTHDVHFGLNLARVVKDVPPSMKSYLPLLSAPGTTLTVDFTATTMRLEARIPFASADAASEAEPVARQGIGELQRFLPQAITGLSRGDSPSEFKEGMVKVTPFLQDVAAGLNTALVTREGKEIRVEMTVNAKDPATGSAYSFCTFLAPLTVARSSPPARPGR